MDKEYMKYNEIAEMLKVLAHPVRLCIINGLLGEGECNVSHMQDCLDIPQSTLSQHLQKLRSAKLIEGKRNGLEINYSVCNERVKELIKVLLKPTV
jgi:DNA-binding transcriptional ArsR family regulator